MLLKIVFFLELTFSHPVSGPAGHFPPSSVPTRRDEHLWNLDVDSNPAGSCAAQRPCRIVALSRVSFSIER